MEVNIKREALIIHNHNIFQTTSRYTHYSLHTDFDVSVTEYFKPNRLPHYSILKKKQTLMF